MRLVRLVLLLVVAGSACSDPVVGGSVVGSWAQVQTIPGSSLAIDLVQDGSSVSGDGTWCGEALRCGTLTVSGTNSGTTVRLDITLDSGSILHFGGKLRTFSTIEGSSIWETPGQQPQVLPLFTTFKRS
jgi:hypothetical protein